MASFNRVMLMGNLTRNPELRYTPSGTAVTDLGLAVNESFKNKAGETVEQTCFVEVVVWGRQAETSSEFLKKGSPVFVEGRLQFEQWESQEGEKRSKIRVRGERVQFLSSNGNLESNSSSPSHPGNEISSQDTSDDDVPF